MVVLIVAASLVAFWRVPNNGFVNYDDDEYVVDNPHVQQGLTYASVKWAFTSSHSSNWHPLTWLSHMADWSLYGSNPMGHHLTNLLLHILGALLLFWFLRHTTGMIWRSAFVALLFSIHPMHVESVAWVAERKDVLSGVFWMLTMLSYGWYAKSPRIGRYLLVVMCYALGLLTKPMLVSLPLVLLLLDFWPLRRMMRSNPQAPRLWGMKWNLVLEKIPLLVMATVSCFITYIAQRNTGAVSPLDVIPLSYRAANAISSYAAYVAKLFLPVNLSAFYPLPQHGIPMVQILAGVCLIAGGLVAGVFVRRRHPYVLVGWLWYMITLVPVIGLVQVGRQAMADRYTYLPYIGLFVIIAWVVPDILVRREPARDSDSKVSALGGLSVAFVLVLIALTSRQTSYWKDSVSLFSHALNVVEENATTHLHLAMALDAEGRGGEAVGQYSRALALEPNNAEAHNNFGTCLASLGRVEEALTQFRIASRIRPGNLSTETNIGNALADLGRLALAAKQYRTVLSHRPEFAEARIGLGNVFARLGHYDDSVREYEHAVRLRPELIQARIALATVCYLRRDYAAAWSHVHAYQDLGGKPPVAFLQRLSKEMSEPPR